MKRWRTRITERQGHPVMDNGEYVAPVSSLLEDAPIFGTSAGWLNLCDEHPRWCGDPFKGASFYCEDCRSWWYAKRVRPYWSKHPTHCYECGQTVPAESKPKKEWRWVKVK